MEEVFEILKVINNNGYQAYLVGGYPRDKYMNRKTFDYDIATNATPKEIAKIFKSNIISNNYGCVNIIYKDKKYEITTYRKDIKYKDNRKPVKIEYVNDIKIDLMRRDFTMNTILIDINGNYLDFFNGMKDIDNKTIKVVGDTDKKISEDALRILRAIRFATILNFKLSNQLIDSIKKYGYLVKNISYVRKKQELDQIFSSENVSYGIKLIRKLELEKYLEINTCHLKITHHLIGIWAQINNFNYPFTKTEKNNIIKINELLTKNVLDNYTLYKYGLYICIIVADIKNININEINKKYNNLRIKKREDIAITPTEICSLLNKKPGYFLNTILTDLENNIVNNKIINDKNNIVKYLKETYL